MDIFTYISTETSRLDAFLTKKMVQSRSQITQLIKMHGVDVDGHKVTKAGFTLKANQTIKVTIEDPIQTTPEKIDFDIEILFEDEDVLIINKPSGLVTHPAPSVNEPTLVHWLKHNNIRLSTISSQERHGIVHRLDKGTSGVMVVAKNNEAHEFLSLQLQNKTMGRYYLAITSPPLKNEITTIEAPLARSIHNRLKIGSRPNGKYAKTQFKKTLLSNNEQFDLLTCKLFTGRTHQIRAHLETLNRHILGDHLYGTKIGKNEPEHILLHAYMLYFVHPKTKQKKYFTAPIDTLMNTFLEQNFNMETVHEKIKLSAIESGFTDIN